jgi:hypothetical protein
LPWCTARAAALRQAHPDAPATFEDGSPRKEDNMQKKSPFAPKPPVRPEPARTPMTPLAPEQLRHVAGGPIGNPTS